MQDHEMEIEVFRAGDYGPRGVFDEEALDRIAGDYDPARHEAPVTVDHRKEGPALGWVRGLRRAGRVLVARLGGLDPDFLKRLREGAFKKRSVEIYPAFAETGRPYLRAVTFLGAASPVVKGLADPVFAENEEPAPVELAEPEAPGAPAAETPAPPATEDAAETPGAVEAAPPEPEPEPESDPPQPDESDREEAAAFCEALARRGRLLPAWRERGIEAFLAALDDATPRSFAGDAEPVTPRRWFRRFLETLEPAVPLGETAAAPFAETPLDPEPEPESWRGAAVDAASKRLHERVRRWRLAHPGCAYAEALQEVCRTL